MALKTHILRLGSVGAHTVGGAEAGMIDLIYAFLLQQYGQDVYSYIHVNQIRDDIDLNELIIKEGKKIHINIYYAVYDDFEQKSPAERNRIRLDIVHTALLRIAAYDNKLDIQKLQVIRQKILDNNFCFDFVYRTFINKRFPKLTAKVIIHPQIDRFCFFVYIEQDSTILCRVPIYQGKTTDWYFKMFSKGKWTRDKSFTIANNEVAIKVQIEQCKAEIKNLTAYDMPPYFQIMKAGLSKDEQDQSYNDWIHSLPPAIAYVITTNLN